MRWITTFAIVLATLGAQGQRTPGRVGGSPNPPPAVTRTQKQADAGTVSMLSDEEKQQYAEAQKQIPKLTVRGFLILQAAAKSANKIQGGVHTAIADTNKDTAAPQQEVNVNNLATQVASHKNDLVAALQALGIKREKALEIRKQSKSEAEAKVAAQKQK